MEATSGKEAQMSHLRLTRFVHTTLAALVIAVAAPTIAQAHYAAGDIMRQQPQTHCWNAQPNQLDMLGPKYVTVHRCAVSAPAVAASSGFDWTYAGAAIGAAVLTLGLIAAAGHHHRRGSPPKHGTLAGA